MDEGTKRLGEALQASRESRRPRVTQPQAAEELGVSRTTVQNLEAGKFTKINRTVRDYARLLGWPEGRAERIYAGDTTDPGEAGEASTVPDDETCRPEPEPAGDRSARDLPLPPAVEYELRTNETLESTVISLGPDEEDGHVIVVLQGRKGVTDEDVARISRRYGKARRFLQGLASDDEAADS